MVVVGIAELINDIKYLFQGWICFHYIITHNEEEIIEQVSKHRKDVIVCSQNEDYWRTSLQSLQLVHNVDFFLVSDLYPILEKKQKGSVALFRRVFFAKHFVFHQCNMPFLNAEIADHGKVYLCCSGFIPTEIGTIGSQTFENIWSSLCAKILRLSLLNGTGVFCDPARCSFLRRRNPYEGSSNDHYFYEDMYPINLNIAVDHSCNLYCVSCRDRICIQGEEERRSSQEILKKLEDTVIKKVPHLYVAGNGEVFLSRVYQEFLQDIGAMKLHGRLHILTNAQLLNIEQMDDLAEKFYDLEILVSIDAASQSVYEKLRRGGSYQQLIKSLGILSDLRKKRKYLSLVFRFVIQKDNYFEIPDFLKLADRFHADRIDFTRINNHPGLSDDLFGRLTLLDEEGNLKEEYIPFFRYTIKPLLGKHVTMDSAFLV